MNSIIDDKLEISHVFHAPRAKLWEAWTKPEHVMGWWGPEGFYAPSVKIDFERGGKYIYGMHGPAGSPWDKDMYSGGEFLEIIPNEKIEVTTYFCDEQGSRMAPSEQGLPEDFPDEQHLTVLFEDVDEDDSLLRIIYTLPDDHGARAAMIASGIEQGWGTSLLKLEGVLKTF